MRDLSHFSLKRLKKKRICPKCGTAVCLIVNPTEDLMLGMYCSYCPKCDVLIKISDTEVEQ